VQNQGTDNLERGMGHEHTGCRPPSRSGKPFFSSKEPCRPGFRETRVTAYGSGSTYRKGLCNTQRSAWL
jgi:hypothetical protein